VSVESRLADVEESLRLLRNADRLQGRRFSAAAPSPGAVPSWNTTTKVWEPSSGLLDRDLDQVEIVSSTTETTLYSHSIPADTTGLTGGVRVSVGGDYLNNSLSNKVLTLRVKLGSTTVFSRAFQIPTDAERRKWTLDVWFLNSTASAQKWSAVWIISPALSDALAIPTIDGTGGNSGAGLASSTEDTTAALTLDFTAEHGTNAATISIRKEIAMMELLSAV